MMLIFNMLFVLFCFVALIFSYKMFVNRWQIDARKGFVLALLVNVAVMIFGFLSLKEVGDFKSYLGPFTQAMNLVTFIAFGQKSLAGVFSTSSSVSNS